jgi:hypothetical protein
MKPKTTSLRQTWCIGFLVIVGLTAFASRTVRAVENTGPTVPPEASSSPRLGRDRFAVRSPMPSRTPNADQIAQIKARADAEINRRVTALNSLINRLNGMKHLSADQKSSLISEIQSNITNLTTLKTKIDADTDLTTLRTDIQSITKAYRIFWLFMPKISIMSAADRILDITAYIATLFPKAQAKIDAAKAAGQDVTRLQSLLDEAKAKTTDATNQANNAVSTVSPLVPDNGNDQALQSNIAILKSARGMIIAAVRDLQTVREDLRMILEYVRQNRSPEPRHTPLASVTPAATAVATASPAANPTP